MTHAIEQGDFVEVEFVGKLKENGEIVDTNKREIAQQAGILSPQGNYEPVIACIGSKQLLPGIDDGLVGKTLGTHTFDLLPEQGFGRKNPKFIQLIATSKFIQNKVNPIPGLPVEIDGMRGTVRSAAGGRTIVDFNHPLSGREVVYEVTVNKIITDREEKLRAVLEKHLGIKEFTIEIDDTHAKVTLSKDIPPQLGQQLALQIVRMIPQLKKLDFVQKDTTPAMPEQKLEHSEGKHALGDHKPADAKKHRKQ